MSIFLSYNLNHLTEWLRDQNLQESGASDCLQPLTQAVQLFLCKKDETSISNVCTKLTIVQVKKTFLYSKTKISNKFNSILGYKIIEFV
jgi:hypothetical protein